MSERLGWYFAYLFQISGVNAVIVVKGTLDVWEKLEKTVLFRSATARIEIQVNISTQDTYPVPVTGGETAVIPLTNRLMMWWRDCCIGTLVVYR